jgi:two-component system competent response regulator ComA
MIEILLVDDHPSVMQGTKMLLEEEGDIKVHPAQSSDEAIELAATRPFDVMLIDFNMPGISGIDLAKQIITGTPNAIILIYTGFDFNNHFNLMIDTGISGFIQKTANKEQLVTAVRCALRGEVILPLSLVKQLRRSGMQTSEMNNEPVASAVCGKEYEILKEISKGKSNKEIAETLMMSQRSLEYSLTALFQKLHVRSRIEAVVKAKQIGLLIDFDFHI